MKIFLMHIAICGVFFSVQCAVAESYSASLTNLCGTYSYMSSNGPQATDIHTTFTTVSNVYLSLSGYNSSGFWSGGMCTGPIGSLIGINKTTYQYLNGTGSFTTNIVLDRIAWSNALDGILSISICNGFVACIDGGGFVTNPWFSLSSVVLTVEGAPEFMIKGHTTDGAISWSSTPNNITARVECVTALSINWTTCMISSASRTGAVVTLPDSGPYFLRAVYNK